MNKELKKLIMRIRIDRGLTQKAMADELGVSATTLSQVEGALRNMSKGLAAKIIKMYGLAGEEAEIILAAQTHYASRLDLLEGKIVALEENFKQLQRLIYDNRS